MSRQAIGKSARQAKLIASLKPPTLGQPRKQIELLCRAIALKFRPDKIVLFGSHAHGHQRPESDV